MATVIPARFLTLLVICWSLVVANAADVADLQELYRANLPRLTDGYQLSGTLTETFHPGVQVDLRTEIWSAGEGFREVQKIDGWVAHVRNWDGRQLLFGEGHRLRHPLETDRQAFRQGQEVWSLISGEAAPEAFGWEAGEGQSVEGKLCRQLIATSNATGTRYRLFVLPETGHVRAILYKVEPLYGGIPQPAMVEYLLLDHAPDTGLPRELRIARSGELQATWRLVASERWTPPDDEFFSRPNLEAYLARQAPLPLDDSPSHQQHKRQYIAGLKSLLASYADLRAAPAARLATVEPYAAALNDPRTTILIEPTRIGPHSSGHYMPMDVDPEGVPRMDVITLRRAPGPGADPINLLHEASHLLIRRHQVKAPILAADDEDLVAFQEEMVHLMDSLRVYEDLAFAKERGDDWETWMLRRWGHVVFRIRYGLADHQLDERELAQFHAITGFHVDLDQIREIYLAAGIPERLLPLTLNDRFTRLLRELNSHQLSLRD